MTSEVPPQKKNISRKQLAFIITGCLLAPPALSVLIVVFIMQPVKVEGTSMAPALKPGDKMMFAKRVGSLKRGDIVIFNYPQDPTLSYISRVVGLPEETLSIESDGKTYINGSPIDEPYLLPDFYRWTKKVSEMKIPADHYFVMGDWRDGSNDSRYWGTVPRNLIYGKYWWTYWKAE